MGLVDRALRASVSRGIRHGLGGSRLWIVIGITATGWRIIRRVSRPAPEVLYRTELGSDDQIEVRTHGRG